MKKREKKNSVKQKAASKAASTQRYLQFAGVHDDTLVLKNGGIRAILEVGALNFNLKSKDEQEAIIRQYQQFLNALDFPVQILVASRKLDIENYVEGLKRKRKMIENPLLQDQMGDYTSYVSRLVEYADIMEKRFYIVVPNDPYRAQKKSAFSRFLQYITPDDKVLDILARRKEFKALKKELDGRLNVVVTAIENIGLPVRRLTTAEIIEVFYEMYNPHMARQQKFTSVEELSLAGHAEQNIVSLSA